MGSPRVCTAVRACLVMLWLLVTVHAQTGDAATSSAVTMQLATPRNAERIPLLLQLARLRRDEPAAVVAIADEVLGLLQAHPSPPQEVAARLARSRALQTLGDYPAALADAQRGEQLAITTGRDDLLARATFEVGHVEWRMADYRAALTHGESARKLQEPLGRNEALVDTLTLLGAIHQSEDELDAALEHYLEALQIGEQLGDERTIARSHNNIGLVYWDLGRHEPAYAALRRALVIHERIGPKPHLANTLSNLGLVSIEMGRAREAVPFLERALALDEQAGNLYGQAKALANLGAARENTGEPQRALELHAKALSLRERIGDKEGIVRTRGALADMKFVADDVQGALAELQPAITLAVAIGARRDEADLQRTLALVKERLGDDAGALAAHRRFHTLRTELSDAESKRRLDKLQIRYEAVLHEREVAELTTRAQSQQQKLERYLVGSALLAACLVLLTALFTHRARAQRRLAESETRYRTLFQTSMVPTLLMDPASGRVLDLNAPANSLCGALSKSGALTVADLQPEWVRCAIGRLLAGNSSGATTATENWVDDDGRARCAEVRGSQVALAGRQCRLVTLRETTEERAHEEARLREDKLRSLGTLAGGIAHDFNNALAAIVGYVSLAKDPAVGDRSGLLDCAEGAALAARGLSQQLLAFAKGGAPVRETTEVGRLLRDSAMLASAGSQVRTELNLPADLWPAPLDPSQFRQVVSNLVLNAQQAMPEGGRLLIRATNFVGNPVTAMPDGDRRFVRIEFVDHGAAIPASVRPHVFDPYFKTSTGGSGLGLATAFAICSNHGGTLTFETREGHGTTFTACFPATPESVAPAAAQPPPQPTGGGSVLVLDDDPLVQTVFQRFLERWGFEVVGVADGRNAIHCYFERLHNGKRFDLLIMDLTIPGGVGGRQAMAEILEFDPQARAIVASGYSDDPVLANYRAAGFVAALAKPFQAADLAQAIHVARGTAVPSSERTT